MIFLLIYGYPQIKSSFADLFVDIIDGILKGFKIHNDSWISAFLIMVSNFLACFYGYPQFELNLVMLYFSCYSVS